MVLIFEYILNRAIIRTNVDPIFWQIEISIVEHFVILNVILFLIFEKQLFTNHNLCIINTFRTFAVCRLG